jgi:hypothetical protein|nr:hypothetical protein [Kofleriaceae bacterium]
MREASHPTRVRWIGGVALGVALATGAIVLTASGHHHRGEHERDSRPRQALTHRASAAELATRDRVARVESAKIEARKRMNLASVPATTWVSLGPTDAFDEYNGIDIGSVDSGRPNGIASDPRDPNIVYMAVSAGGLWKTFDFGSAAPHWNPIFDTQPDLAIGAFAMDPANPDVLYVGTGDFVDTSGDTIQKSTDGGSTWSTPVALSGMTASGHALTPLSVRSLGVSGQTILAGTDAGMFVSNDGGATFALVDLPGPNNTTVPESIWTVLTTGGTSWVASGVSWCSDTSGAAVFDGTGVSSGCKAGNFGSIWTSNDNGATWKRAALAGNDIGRTNLGVGALGSRPGNTEVYSISASINGGQTMVGVWHSSDGGATWTDASGVLSNPTEGNFSDCPDFDIANGQAWYDLEVLVDPTNADHVLVGGSLCGARTLDGTGKTPTWELVSDWLPEGETSDGVLPYVHADWHAGYAMSTGSGVVAFAGTDGGIFTATNLWSGSANGAEIDWVDHNHGLVTHLIYAVASGDPATQNPFVLFGGLQDNGTRFRADPNNPSVFNQVVGGDGIGATVHVATSGTTYWASAEFSHSFCQPGVNGDCSDGTQWEELDPPGVDARPEDDDDDGIVREDDEDPWHGRWHRPDSEPFFVHYANVETDGSGQSVLTHTTDQVWVAGLDGGGNMAWTAISQDFSSSRTGQGFGNVSASRAFAGLYGAAGLSPEQPFYVTTTGNTPSQWVASAPVTVGGVTLLGPSSIDFPPTLPVGANPGDVYVGSFTDDLNDGARTPPPDDQGRLYRTVDGGKTWTSLVGSDPTRRLPNVAVYVVKYDPVVATTLYAGTDIGVYYTTDDGAHWDRMGDGFPMVPARDLYVAKNQDFIRAVTYGRGFWEIYPSAAANQGSPGNGDFDRNDTIDWVDLGAMSARLGETPATPAAPLYTWIDDIVGSDATPLAEIDDSDLNALLGVFGGHP